MNSQLRNALLANAAVSLASGVLMVIAPQVVSDWLGLDIAGWLRAFGVVLVGHAALIAVLLPRLELRRLATLNFLAIAPYPFALAAVLIAGLVERSLGQGLVVLDAVVIGAIALVHAGGLRKPAGPLHTQTA